MLNVDMVSYVVWGSEALLAALVALMLYTIARSRRQDWQFERESGIRSPVFASSAPAITAEVAAESKAQIQLFWAAQILDLKLNRFDVQRLSHPAIQGETRRYLEGVADSVSDHYGFNEAERHKLSGTLQDKYVVRSDNSPGMQKFDLREPRKDGSNQSFQSGYEAAAYWMQHRKFQPESSLLKAIEAWGFID